MSAERNFRTGYYKKIGCESVEEKKNLDKLLREDIRSHDKLKNFCLHYTVPTAERSLLWNIIMGIQPLYKHSTDYILNIRKTIYDDLFHAATVLQAIDSKTPKYKIFHSMWLIENNRLLHPNTLKDAEESNDVYIEIVKVLLEIFEDDVEVYWIAKEFYNLTREIKQECFHLKEITQTLVKREDIALHEHLEHINIYNSKIIDRWYISCFAGIINETALIRIWDKVCGGSRKIVIYLLLSIITTFRNKILKCTTGEEFKDIVSQVKDPDGVIVNKAIKAFKIHSDNESVLSKAA